MPPSPRDDLLVLRDAALAPRLFQWNGPIAPEALEAWRRDHGLVVPPDLMYLWSATGGGELFETEDLLAPLSDTPWESFDDVNAAYHREGLHPSYLVFHTGIWASALRQPDGALVALDDRTFSVRGTYHSVDEWYARGLRAVYAERYGLPSVTPPST